LRDRRVIVTVAGGGPGIPEDVMPLLFEPFFTTRPAGEGTGLGLSIRRKIVIAHGGTLEVESEIGPGTRFRVRLPIDPALTPDSQAI